MTDKDTLREIADNLAGNLNIHPADLPKIDKVLQIAFDLGKEAGWEEAFEKHRQEDYEAGKQAGREEAANCLPKTWLDEIFHRKSHVKLPWNCLEIELYTCQLVDRIRALMKKPEEKK